MTTCVRTVVRLCAVLVGVQRHEIIRLVDQIKRACDLSWLYADSLPPSDVVAAIQASHDGRELACCFYDM